MHRYRVAVRLDSLTFNRRAEIADALEMLGAEDVSEKVEADNAVVYGFIADDMAAKFAERFDGRRIGQ